MELLGVDESPVKGEGTPGDFANVVRQRNLLGEELAPEEFLRRLMTRVPVEGAERCGCGCLKRGVSRVRP